MNDIKSMLLLEARKGDFKSVKTVLENNKHLDLDFTDEAGKTLLHYAANSGQVDVVKMVLQRTLSLNTTDKAGQAPIHYAVKQGHVAILKLLVRNGAKVDFTDKQKKRTALHYAVYKNKVKAAEYLISAGASQTIQDIDGKTPSDLCQSGEMRMALSNLQDVTKEYDEITFLSETNKIYEGSKISFRKSGLVVEYINTGKGDYFNMVCRRNSMEDSHMEFAFQEKEEVMSDVFVYHISCSTDCVLSILSVPLFSGPDQKEEMVIKTNTHNDFLVTDVEEDKTVWTCKFKADLKTFSAFVAVCRPKRECFEIGTEASTFHSKVDERVEILIPENAFEEPTKLTMEITNTPDMSGTGNEDTKDIISATSFYSINTSGGKPIKPISFKVPLPSNYNGIEKVDILSMEENVEEEEQDETRWSVLEMEVNVINNMAVFDLASFSVKVGIQSYSRKNDELKRQVSYLYRKSRRKEHSVIFLLLIKRVGDTNTWMMAVECCPKANADERQKYWETKLYEKQESKMTDSITAFSKQKYRLKLNEFIRPVGMRDDTDLVFHPKRDNFQQIQIQTDGDKPFVLGGLEIIQLPSQNVRAGGHENHEEEKLLSSFQFKLERILPVPTNTSTDHERRKEVSPSKDNFLSDIYIMNLVKKLKHNWFPVIILMGIPFTEVDEVLVTQGDVMDKLTKLVLNWRDTNREREDLGVPIIVSALCKGAFGLSKDVHADLKMWHDTQTDPDDTFYKWLKKAYKDSNLLNPGDYAKPMSDSYLAIIGASLEPTLEMAQVLDLTEEQHNEVLQNKCYTDNHLRVMKLLIVFRNSSQSMINRLEKLIQALETLNKTQARKKAIMYASAWGKQTTDPDETFRTEVNGLLTKLT